MTTQNLTTARFVLQSLLQELEAFDRCIPVAHDIQVGDVADALTVFMADRRILRLTAPSPRATADVALGGRAVGTAGTWSPANRLQQVTGGAGSLVLAMPSSSAALVTLPPTPGGPSIR